MGRGRVGKFNIPYNFLRNLADIAGFNLVMAYKKRVKNSEYEFVTPSATYAPWISDIQFKKTYNLIKKYTLVDIYRCYELWQLVEETKKINGDLIEIGVWRGGSGALIAQKVKLGGTNDTVYLCDTFSGVVKAGIEDASYKGGEHADTSKKTVENIINMLQLDNTKILVGIFPEKTGKLVSDKIFRFCHIDVDVYNSAKDIVNWIWNRLSIGGMIVFDDYGFERCNGITKLVNDERIKKDRLVIHNLNGHAILIKIK